MKRVLSLVLALVMSISLMTPAYAMEADFQDWNQGTDVTYTGSKTVVDSEGNETYNTYYTVTVPKLLAPGTSGDVIASGNWPSNRVLSVTADETVRLTNSITGGNRKTLEVGFSGITLRGSNTTAVRDEAPVSVEQISNALFGTWSGHFDYNVSMSAGIKVTSVNSEGINLNASAYEITGSQRTELLDSLEESSLITSADDIDVLVDVESDEFDDMATTTFDMSNVASEGDTVVILHYDETEQQWEYVSTETVDANGEITADFSSYSPVAFEIIKATEPLVVFDTPYVGEMPLDGTSYSYPIRVIFYEDGSADMWMYDSMAGLASSGTFTYSGNKIVDTTGEFGTITVSGDGSVIAGEVDGTNVTLYLSNANANGIKAGTYYADYYGILGLNAEVVVDADGNVKFYDSGILAYDIPASSIHYYEDHFTVDGSAIESTSDMTCRVYPDWSMFEFNGYVFKYGELTIQFGEPYTGTKEVDGVQYDYEYYFYSDGSALSNVYTGGSLTGDASADAGTLYYRPMYIGNSSTSKPVGVISNNGKTIDLLNDDFSVAMTLTLDNCSHTNCTTKELGKVCNDCGLYLVPDGAAYYVGVTSTVLGEYAGASGNHNAFPDTVSTGDVFVYGDYEYRYNYSVNNAGEWSLNDSQNGWGVSTLSKTKEEYGEILSSINGKPITSMTCTFYDCTEFEVAPAIPGSVTNLMMAFGSCTSMTTAPIIPNSISSDTLATFATFHNCESLITYTGSTDADGDFSNYKIPDGTTGLMGTFYGCKSMVYAPEIPSSVTVMQETFEHCSSLLVAPIIPTGVTNIANTFNGCTSLVSYVGSTAADGDFRGYTIPNTVNNMAGTFAKCSKMEYAPSIPSSVTNIEGLFQNSASLIESPEIPNGIKDMAFVFRNCSSLVTAPTIPYGVTSLQSTFEGCTSLKTYAGSTAADGDFSGYVIPDSVTYAGSAFDGCILITNPPIIPDGAE